MARNKCRKCGGPSFSSSNTATDDLFGTVCPDCKRQEAFLSAQRETALQSSPEGRRQLAKERKQRLNLGCLKFIAYFIGGIIVIFSIVNKSNEGAKNSRSSENKKSNFTDTNDSFEEIDFSSSLEATSVVGISSDNPQIQKSYNNTDEKLSAINMFYIVINISSNDVLNVREKPSSSSRIVGKLKNGDKVMLGSNNNLKNTNKAWIYISNGKCEGWVNSYYLKKAN
jgi:hypothetical protein